MTTRVSILGSGSWGSTMAKVLGDGGNEVTLWARRPELAREINETSRNSDYLPGINLPANVRAVVEVSEAIDGADIVFWSVPSQSLRANLEASQAELAKAPIVVSLMKGVEAGTGLRMSEVIEQAGAVDREKIAVLSGPNLALEIAKEQPTASVASSVNPDVATAVAKACQTPYFRTFVNYDVVGTEFGGVLKNLIALAVGIADGVGYGENTKASIITRGLAEISAFAAAFGAEPQTMAGLAGLGDLIATCESPLSRNNTAGRLLGQGFQLADVVRRMNQTAEGIQAVAPILELAESRGVTMPIIYQVGQVLDGTLNPRELAPHLATDSDEVVGE